MAIDAERIRARFEEIRRTAVKAGDGVGNELATASMDQNNVFRQATLRALEVGEGAERTSSMALESAANCNKAMTELGAEMTTVRDETAQLAETVVKTAETAERARKEANTAKASSSAALNLAQKGQLEASLSWIVIKNIPQPDNGEKEMFTDRMRGVQKVLGEIGIREQVHVAACHRLPSKVGLIPNMRVQLAGEAQRRLVFEAVDKAIKHKISEGDNTPFEHIISADIPTYAKKKFKELNILGQLHRDNAPQGTRTRVAMKGAWPALFIRAAGKNKYEEAGEQLMNDLRSAARKKRDQKRKTPGAEAMDLDNQPSGSKAKKRPDFTKPATVRSSARNKSKDK